jgi:hypothetical protein
MSLSDITSYIDLLSHEDQIICKVLNDEINNNLTNSSSKLRHGHPVWFLNENPIVWYSKQKRGVVLLFRSGQDFDEPDLKSEWKFKAAEIVYTHADQITTTDLKRWLEKGTTIQRDYKNIVKRKGKLEKIVS